MFKKWHCFIVLLQVAAVLGLLALRPDVAILFCLLGFWALVGECWVEVYLNRRERIQAMKLATA